MPPRKKRPLSSLPVPEVPVLLPPVEDMTPNSPGRSSQVGIAITGFLFLFSILLFSSEAMRAQEFRAAVSATVRATDYVPPDRFPFERWWNSLDSYTRLMVGSSGALTVVAVPLGLLAWRTLKRGKKQSA